MTDRYRRLILISHPPLEHRLGYHEWLTEDRKPASEEEIRTYLRVQRKVGELRAEFEPFWDRVAEVIGTEEEEPS